MDPHELYVLWETSARREGLMSEISQLEFGGLGQLLGGPRGMVTPGEDEDQV